jgi:hypothetical protein
LVDLIQELADASVYVIQYAESTRPEDGGFPADRSGMELAYETFELLSRALREYERREDRAARATDDA